MQDLDPPERSTPPRVWPLRALRWGLGVLALFAILVGVDVWHGWNRTARGLTVGGQDLGRLTRTEMQDKVRSITDDYTEASIPIRIGDQAVSVKGRDLGLQVDQPKFASAAFAVGRSGRFGNRISAYVGGWFGGTDLDVPVSVSPSHLRRWLRKADESFVDRPGAPELSVANGRWVATPGKAGRAVDPTSGAAIIARALRDGPSPTTAIGLKRVEQASSHSEAELGEYAKALNAATGEPLAIVVGPHSISLSPNDLRSLTKAAVVAEKALISFDGAEVMQTVKARVGDISTSPIDARFEVATEPRPAGSQELTVRVVPSVKGTRCCRADSVDRLTAALRASERKLVVLELDQIEASISTESLQSLGIVEPIGTFTTKHKAGEVRVKNIHRIADLLQGMVIKPGETFSVNDTIGPRSEANGFFSAGVIEQGIFKEDFGGGISQFATTMFNAAFFAGLDLVEYQSHSLYISRYPYGREATLSFPSPDLKIRNNTPHGILIWPSYTNSTITVTLFSTRFVTGDVAGQSKRASQLCTQVTTTRKRTYVDGRTEFDSVQALYRPAEGKDCNGQLTPAARQVEREKQAAQRAREKARLARQRAREQARAQRQRQSTQAAPSTQPVGAVPE